MFAAHWEPETQDGRVVRCTGTSTFFNTANEARDAGELAERPFVVADEKGVIA